jgi:hypothetical protein
MTPAQRVLFTHLDTVVSEHLVKNLSSPAGEIIHYTNLDGLIGILKSGTLYAGNLIAMNDASEFVHGRRLLLKMISESPPLGITSGMAKVVEFVKLQSDQRKEPPRAYVASFTSKSDATTHWQGYAGPSGVAIHFDAVLLASQAKAIGAHFLPCLYKEDTQRTFVGRLFAAMLTECKAAIDKGECKTDAELDWLGEAILYNLARVAAVMKSDAFEHEAEWRCIYYLPWDGGLPENVDLSKVEFINRAGMLSARVTLNFLSGSSSRLLPIKKITIGPSMHQPINALTIPVLLAKHGYRHVEVNQSPSPLRQM